MATETTTNNRERIEHRICDNYACQNIVPLTFGLRDEPNYCYNCFFKRTGISISGVKNTRKRNSKIYIRILPARNIPYLDELIHTFTCESIAKYYNKDINK